MGRPTCVGVMGGFVGSGANGREGILEDVFGAKDDFIKARGQDPRGGRTVLGMKRVAPYILCSWGGKVKREASRGTLIC